MSIQTSPERREFWRQSIAKVEARGGTLTVQDRAMKSLLEDFDAVLARAEKADSAAERSNEQYGKALAELLVVSQENHAALSRLAGVVADDEIYPEYDKSRSAVLTWACQGAPPVHPDTRRLAALDAAEISPGDGGYYACDHDRSECVFGSSMTAVADALLAQQAEEQTGGDAE